MTSQRSAQALETRGPGGVRPLLAAAAIAAGTAAALAEGLELPGWTLDGGGGRSQGSGYALHATLGQPDAGTSHGGGFALAGGFWPAATDALFADGFETGGAERWSASVPPAP